MPACVRHRNKRYAQLCFMISLTARYSGHTLVLKPEIRTQALSPLFTKLKTSVSQLTSQTLNLPICKVGIICLTSLTNRVL